MAQDSFYQSDIGQEAYSRLMMRWHWYSFRCIAYFCAVISLLELTMPYIIYLTGNLRTTVPVYLVKYIVFPIVSRGAVLLVLYAVLKYSKLQVTQKNYAISFCGLMICFIITITHSLFIVAYMCYLVPSLFTLFYGDERLTRVTTFLALILYGISYFFLSLNPALERSNLCLFNFFFGFCLILTVYFCCKLILSFGNEKRDLIFTGLTEQNKLRGQLFTDTLTGLYSRLILEHPEFVPTPSSELPCQLAFLDIDNFKYVNDTLGHLEGDRTLKKLGEIIATHCQNAVPIRYGGDEFIILFPYQSQQEVASCLVDIKQDFKSYCDQLPVDQDVSLSIGIANSLNVPNLDDLLYRADSALYDSKEHGKDQISFFNADE